MKDVAERQKQESEKRKLEIQKEETMMTDIAEQTKELKLRSRSLKATETHPLKHRYRENSATRERSVARWNAAYKNESKDDNSRNGSKKKVRFG